MYFFDLYSNLLYSTSDFRQIRYTHILPSMRFYSCDYMDPRMIQKLTAGEGPILQCREVSRSKYSRGDVAYRRCNISLGPGGAW